MYFYAIVLLIMHDTQPNFRTDQQTPDYGYENGLAITRSVYGGDMPIHTKLSIDYDEMRPLDLTEYVPHQEKVVRKVGKTALEWRLLRSEKETSTLNVILMGWAGDNDNPITQDGFRYHAAQNPHADIIHVNNPAHGDSSHLPLVDALKIARTGHFAPQGELLAEMIGEAAKDYDDVNIAGHSYGARQAMALAAELDRPVNSLHLFDPPGSRKLGLAGLTKAFLSLEGNHAGQYNLHAPDQVAAEIQRRGDSTAGQDIQKLIRRGGFVEQFALQTLAMSHAGLEHDLALAARNVRNTIKFTSPALSELNYVDDVSAIINRIATVSRSIQHDVIQDHTHSMIASNPSVLAYIQQLPK
jgi:pimeloyl-ACP methyl ester carboxylesterase